MKGLNRVKSRNEKKSPVMVIGITLGVMYLISGVLLLILSALLYNLELSEATVKIGIVAIYITSGCMGGLLIGRQMQDKKYLWGLLAGGGYFLLLFAIFVI